MKKLFCILLAGLLCLSLAACRKETPSPAPDSGSASGAAVPADGAADSRPQAQPEQPGQPAPLIELPDHELDAAIRFVSAYNAYPQPFASTGELSDYALFFAAAARMNAAFTPESDGATYSLPILELEAAVRAIFGAQAALSDGWTRKDYSPYTVDEAAGVVRKMSTDAHTVPLYPYRCARMDDGLELTMLCLSDPLFAGQYSDAADNPDAVTAGMLRDIAGDMMAYVYTLSQNEDGGYTLCGFRIVNEKALDAF